MLSMLALATTHRPHPELLFTRPHIVVKERSPSHLTLYLRLFNSSGALAVLVVGGFCVGGLYIALFSWLQWAKKYIFLVVALLPVLTLFYIYVVYRAIAPLEEFLFDRESRTCCVSTTLPCSTTTSILEGVTHVHAAIYEFVIDGAAAAPTDIRSRGWELHIHHREGVHKSKTLWPEGDAKLRRAVRKINRFLETISASSFIHSSRLAPDVEPVLGDDALRNQEAINCPIEQEEETKECHEESMSKAPGPHHC